jgi:diaminohydroxyphosphoribosylaminopyrimidine deaminase/5-amino-6-(5-phosphoribosylamino)uracil reductase
MTNVLVEGGSQLLGAFLDARLIDEVHVYIAPRLLGGMNALSPIGGRGIEAITDSLPVANWKIEQIGEDLLVHGVINRPTE